MADLKRDIRYIDRDFNQFRNALINYSKTYFPDTFNDFTDTSTGMLFMEMASYVGDVLSFYLDNQIQETFIQKARQQENLYQMAYLLGYEPKVTTAASVDIDFFQQVPAKLSASVYVPDYDYSMIIPENTQITSNTDSKIQFLIEDVIDFSASGSLDPTTTSVYQVSYLAICVHIFSPYLLLIVFNLPLFNLFLGTLLHFISFNASLERAIPTGLSGIKPFSFIASNIALSNSSIIFSLF